MRLARLRGLLAGGDAVTAGALADELGVSTRTLLRDLDLLRDEGFLIETDRGRGGGVRLSRGHHAGSVPLSADEAIDLLISLALAEQSRTPMLFNLNSLRQKLAALFASAARDRIRQLRRRILIGRPASLQVLKDYQPRPGAGLAQIRRAFVDLKVLEVTYLDERGRPTQRRIEPQILSLNPPAWYLIAWDHLRGDVRSFRIDRVAKATCTDTGFRLRDRRLFLAAADADAVSP